MAPTMGQRDIIYKWSPWVNGRSINFMKTTNFELWKVKMQKKLIQDKCIDALKGEESMHARLSKEEKTEMVDKARSTIILCLMDKVLREVTWEKIVIVMWEILGSLYMTKSLAHRLCLKQNLYSLWMMENKFVLEQLIEIQKIIDDLDNIQVKIEDQDNVLLLLSSLPRSFEHFNDDLLYNKECIILD